ncbi:MAG: ISL3 family transposase, partial [Verrucomicrobiaceae bacterium]
AGTVKADRETGPDHEGDDDDDDDGGGTAAGGRTMLVKVPWAEPHSRFTALFESFAVEVMGACRTLTEAARLLKISWDQAQRIMERAVARGLARRQEVVIPHIGIDEKSFGKGHDYATVVLDPARECVHDLGPGRTAEATVRLLERCLPDPEIRLQVSAAVMDMSAAFAAAVRQTLPSAVIVYDRFHVSKLLNTAVDQVRRAEHRRLSAQGDSTLKNTRYHWLTGPENLEPQKLEELEALFARNAVVARAWTDRENFASFWDCSTEEESMTFFKVWERKVNRRKGLQPMKKVAATLRRHLGGLINYITHPLTNGLAEGINSLIAVLKGAARGLRNFSNFRVRVLFFLGKLDMLPAV